MCIVCSILLHLMKSLFDLKKEKKEKLEAKTISLAVYEKWQSYSLKAGKLGI